MTLECWSLSSYIWVTSEKGQCSRAAWLQGAWGPTCPDCPWWALIPKAHVLECGHQIKLPCCQWEGRVWEGWMVMVRWAVVVKFISNEQFVEGSQQFKQYNCPFSQFIQINSLRIKYPFKRVPILEFLSILCRKQPRKLSNYLVLVLLTIAEVMS